MFERSAQGPRALAAKVGGRWISSIAEGLVEQASVRPPDTLEVRLYGRPLRVGLDGAPGLEEAQARIDGDKAVSPTGERLGMAVGLAGVLVLVLTIAAGLPALAVLAGLLIIVGAGIWIKLRADRKQAHEAAEHDKDRLAWQTKTIADTLKECHNRHRKLAETAGSDREAILTVLA
jgi:hypothetical protein